MNKTQQRREEAYAGQFLRTYEGERYTPTEKQGIRSIIVPVDAEQFADGSFYQKGWNWDEYRKNARAVILRIGQNIWQDSEFETFYNEARRVGLLIGGYFFFDGRASPQQQADVIIKAMTGRFLDMELFIDWERNYGGAYEGLPNVVKLMQLVEAAGVRCKAVGMYTGYYFFFENSNSSANSTQYTYLKTRPLWLAWYASPSIVKVPAPWSTWTHWQYGTPAVQWGQPTAELDMNKHNGTVAQFATRYGATTEPEVKMAYFRVTATELNMRSTGVFDADGSNIVGKLLRDDVVQTDDVAVNGWRRIRAIWRSGDPVPVPASAWSSGSYMIATEFTPPVPSNEYILHVKDGVTRKFVLE